MKGRGLLASVVVACLLGVPAGAAGDETNRWTPIGPGFSTVLTIHHDPFDASVVLAGLYFGGLYRSTDYGFSWAHVPTAFSTRSVFSLVFDRSQPGRVYAGTFQQGVFRSDDNGQTWTAVNTGLTALDVQSVDVDPFNSSVLVAVTPNGVFRTSNAGGSWTRTDTAVPALAGKAVVFDPNLAGVVYVGTIGSGVYRSSDDGQTWAPFNQGLVGGSVISLRHSRVSGALYAAVDGGVFKLRPGELQWTDITGDLPPFPVNDVLPHPVFPTMSFVATLSGTYVRVDDESSASAWLPWTLVPARTLASDASGTVMHVASVHGGLEATIDFGVVWYQANWGIQNLFVGALAMVNTGGQPLIYAGSDVRVHRGDSVGWTTAFEPKQAIFDILPHPTDPNTVYIGTERAGVYKTADGGSTWTTAASGIVPAQVHGISEAANQSAVYAATTSGMYIRGAGSDSWNIANTGDHSIFLSVAADPVRHPIVYVGAHEGVVLRSIDGGWSFTFAGTGLPRQNIRTLVAAPWEKVYAITENGQLFGSSDLGVNWYPFAESVPFGITSLAVNPAQSWIAYLGTSGGGVLKTVSAALEWAPANTGLGSPFVFTVAVDPVTPSTVYAATSDGLYKSTNGADTWTRVGTNLPAGTITSLTIDPTHASRIYASIAGVGVYRSGDGGLFWEAATAGLPSAGTIPLYALRSGELMAGTSLEGIFKSVTFGSLWTRTSVGMTLFVRGLTINPKSPSTMYAGSLGAGVFKSTDGAQSWTNSGLRDRNIFKLAIDPITPATVFAATSRGVSRSNNAGATWQHVGQKAAYVYSMAVDPRDRQRILIGSTAGVVFLSVDGGQIWERTAPMPFFTVHAVAIDPRDGTIYASPEEQGVYRSTNNGASWTRLDEGATPNGQFVSALAVHADGTLYAATAGAGAFRYRNGAWAFASEGLASRELAHIAVASDGVLYASSFDAGLFRSTDGGASWSWASYGLTTSRVTSVAPDPHDAAVVYAATPDGVFRSTDRGLTWQARNAGLQRISVHRIVVDLFAPGVLFAATNGDGVFRSQDGGATWQAASVGLINPLVPSLVQGAQPGALFAGTVGNGVMRTVNGGLSWTGGVPPQAVDNFALGIAVNPVNPQIIYVATAGQGVLKSTNGGVDWWPMNNGLEVRLLLSLIIDPRNPETLYAGTVHGGVFYTTNGAAAWKPLNNGLWNDVVTSLALNPADSTELLAGTEGGGVFFNKLSLAPTTCTYAVDATTVVVPAAATSRTIRVTAPSGCTWHAESNDNWVTLRGLSIGAGNGEVTIDIEPHVGEDSRVTTVLVAGHSVALVQRGHTTLLRLTVTRAGTGSGLVTSDWIGIHCGADCSQLFSNQLPVILTAVAGQGSTFVRWEGAADCSDGAVVMTADLSCTALFEQTGDFDEDGLPDMWEMQFGLDPASASGNNGSDGDPDGDGLTNAQERVVGTHPRGFVQRYLADGMVSAGVVTTLDLFNGGQAPAHVLMNVSGVADGIPVYLAGLSRRTLDLSPLVSGRFAISIDADLEIAAERTTTWADPAASTAERASPVSHTWYAPRVVTNGDFDTRLAVFNPSTASASVDVFYIIPGQAPVAVHHTVAGGARIDIDVAAEGPALVDATAAAVVRSDVGVVVEQVTGLGNGRALAAESPVPAPRYAAYFAEGATGPAATSISLFNPTSQAADARITYLLPGGGIVERPHTVAPFATVTVPVHAEDAMLASTAFSAIAWTANAVPLVATRSTWWPGSAQADWYEGHASAGAAAAGTQWAVAGGATGGTGNLETQVIVANVGGSSGVVRMLVVFDDGTSETRDFTVPAVSRNTFDMATEFPSTAGRVFSVLVESLAPGTGPAQPLIVERSTYGSPASVPWAAGAHVIGLMLR